jgi:hypothetical protein
LKSDSFDPIYQKDYFCDQPRGAEMSRQRRAQLDLLPASALLITESADEFDRLGDALDQELKPRAIIDGAG